MSDCLFCKIVRNEIPSYTVYEDGETRAFLDILPRSPGHTMVVLKKHGETIHDYTKDEMGVLWGAVQKVTKGLEKTFKTGVFTIGINHGEKAGVHHLHIHVIPRFPDDGGGVIQSIVKKEGKEGLQEVCDTVKRNMD
jgi:histidine triad (HIT) family protein